MKTKRQSAQEKMQTLLDRQKELSKELNNMRRQVAQQKRKRDAKRKVLAGACILHLVQTGQFSDTTWSAHLDKFLTRPADRELFELTSASPPRGES